MTMMLLAAMAAVMTTDSAGSIHVSPQPKPTTDWYVSVDDGSTRTTYWNPAGSSNFNTRRSTSEELTIGVGATAAEAAANPVATTIRPRIVSISPSAGSATVTVVANALAGSTVEIQGKEKLSDPEWTPAKPGHRFFRAVQR